MYYVYRYTWYTFNFIYLDISAINSMYFSAYNTSLHMWVWNICGLADGIKILISSSYEKVNIEHTRFFAFNESRRIYSGNADKVGKHRMIALDLGKYWHWTPSRLALQPPSQALSSCARLCLSCAQFTSRNRCW